MLYKINLDFKKSCQNQMPVFTFGDNCGLKISVFDDGEPVSEIERATIAIAGVATKVIDPETMIYTFGDEIGKADYYKCTVQIYDGAGRSTTYAFTVRFNPDLSTAETDVTHNPSVVEDIYRRLDENSAQENPGWAVETHVPAGIVFPNCRNGWCKTPEEFYIFGGASFLGDLTSLYDRTFSPGAVAYNFKTRTWRKLKDRPYNINEERAVYKDGKIYLFGALNQDCGDDVYRQNVNQVYDIATDTFSLLPEAPKRLVCTSGAVLIGNKIYIFVDIHMVFENGVPVQKRINTTPYIYDIEAGTWEIGTAAATRFDRGFAVEHEGLIYVQRSAKFMAYNPQTDTWITTLSKPQYDLVHTGLPQIYKNRMFIGSGWQTSKGINKPYIQYYNFATDKWYIATRITFLGEALGYGSLALYDDKLHYFGGYSDDTNPNSNKRILSFGLEQLHLDELDDLRVVAT